MDRWRRAWCWAALALASLCAAGPRYSSRIVHTHAGAIRGIIVEPASRRLEPVEVFLGVPYGGPPARLGPPPPPRPWPGTRLADTFAPVCPQRYPDISNKSAALSKMPLGVYKELRATIPLLGNQSEDCLYLNIYVPGSGARGVEAPYAVVVWAGAAHEWGSGNALDAAVLAARTSLLVLTLNYRVGLLGYLTTSSGADAVTRAGGAALLDVAAALRWTRANVAAFGGDPARVTLAGHAAGAALANALLMLPDSKGNVAAFGGDPARVTLAGHAAGAALANALLMLPDSKGNVAAFGGDPARVTLAGHAAGAALANALLMLPDSKGNVAAFGGDPARVTLAGHAAGAALANALLMLPDSKGNVAAFGGDPARVTLAGHAAGAALANALLMLPDSKGNVAAFGGDPARVTLAGHAAGAALANALLMLPDSKGLISRVVLLSGSALAPAALAPDAALARDHAALALRCVPEPEHTHDWFVECIRARPLGALLAVEAPRARILAGWAPSVPEAAGAGAGAAGGAGVRALHASDVFLECALFIVVATTESYQFFSEEDIRHGFEEEHRNRILRTFVRNVYRFHRNEIFAAVRNEYTDWERPIQHPINIRDATLEALGDAAAAAPALRLAQLHARRGAATYLAHFAHQTKDSDYPQRLGSTTSDTLPYFLGLPLVGGPPWAPHNYSRGDVAVAEAAVGLLASFAKTGAPAPAPAPAPADRHHDTAWPRYELNTQQYLSIGTKLRVKSHYRGHKMALWLHLIPQLHRPGAAPRHHQFRAHSSDMFAGEIFPELYSAGAALDAPPEEEEETREEAGEECEGAAPPARPALAALPSAAPHAPSDAQLTLDSQYYSYTVALGVTVGAGCFLLALNILVFAGIYLQRARRRPPRSARAGWRPPRDGSFSRSGGGGGGGGGGPAEPAGAPVGAVPSPRKSTLKRSCESEVSERAGCAGGGGVPKKRVQIQEISV